MFRKPTVYRLFVALISALTLCQFATPVMAGGGPMEGLANLVKMAVDGLIILAALAMMRTETVRAIAFTGVTSIFAKMAGSPYAESNATLKIIGVVILFILTAFAIPLANAVIDAVMAYHSSEGIHIPGS